MSFVARRVSKVQLRKFTRCFSTMSFSESLSRPSLFQSLNFINGQYVPARSGKVVEVTDPGTLKVIGKIAYGNEEDTEDAIAAAAGAQDMWAATPIAERCAKVKRLGELLIEHKEDLGMILSKEQGKPLHEAIGEVQYGADFFIYYGTHGEKFFEEDNNHVLKAPQGKDRVEIVTKKYPIGVSASLTPWNFPTAMLARKAAPALVAGCTHITKPSELTPFSALAYGILSIEAGIPKGVLNIVCGDSQSIGSALCTSKIVRKLSFTGSTRVGKILMSQSAATVKKLSLELGGNAPVILHKDCDIEASVKMVMNAKLRNAGQTCVSPNRFYIHKDIYEQVIALIKQRIDSVVTGYGADKEQKVDIGPLINLQAVEKVKIHLRDAEAKGATVYTGPNHVCKDLYHSPTLLINCTENMLCFTEETFGPLISTMPYEDVERVIASANNTSMGLAAYVYIQDPVLQEHFGDALEFGMIAINAGGVSNAVAPFGGIKESGYGKEGSKLGLEEYFITKALHTGNK